MTSTIDAAEDALRTLLNANATLSAVPITVEPTGDIGTKLPDPTSATRRDMIFIAVRVDDEAQTPDTTDVSGTGTFVMEEAYTLRVVVWCSTTDSTWSATRVRAAGYTNAIETVVRQNPLLSSTVFDAHVSKVTRTGWATDSAEYAEKVVEVSCLAYLVP